MDSPGQRIRWDPSVGIRRNLWVGFDRPLLLISSFNKLLPGANFRGRSKPPIGSDRIFMKSRQIPIGSDCRIESPGVFFSQYRIYLIVSSIRQPSTECMSVAICDRGGGRGRVRSVPKVSVTVCGREGGVSLYTSKLLLVRLFTKCMHKQAKQVRFEPKKVSIVI
jgi:hypothetical protein